MQKLFFFGLTGLLLLSSNLYGEDLFRHGADLQEIISINTELADIENQLRQTPNNQALLKKQEIIEQELINKLRAYNMKRKSLSVQPAAGPSE